MIAWPVKAREIRSRHMDSTIWNRFAFREGDVVVASYAKSGTTWVQQIVTQLIHGGDPSVAVREVSPWLDYRLSPPDALARLEAQTHRRVVKTHLPLDALTFSPRARYLYVARDGRDVAMSLHHHHAEGNARWYGMLNADPGLGPPMPPADPDVQRWFRRWLETDGEPFWPYFQHVASWWPARALSNVKLIHYADLKADLAGEVTAIAAFLERDLTGSGLEAILEHSSFGFMKAHAEMVAPLGGAIFEHGAQAFIHAGVNGRWRDVLTAQDIADYEARALAELGPECADWLAKGDRRR